jgi:hypothetical protein
MLGLDDRYQVGTNFAKNFCVWEALAQRAAVRSAGRVACWTTAGAACVHVIASAGAAEGCPWICTGPLGPRVAVGIQVNAPTTTPTTVVKTLTGQSVNIPPLLTDAVVAMWSPRTQSSGRVSLRGLWLLQSDPLQEALPMQPDCCIA